MHRLREQSFVNDARIQLALSSLSAEEVILLRKIPSQSHVWGEKVTGVASWYAMATARLLDKGIIKFAMGEISSDQPAFIFTELGQIVYQRINKGLQQFKRPDE